MSAKEFWKSTGLIQMVPPSHLQQPQAKGSPVSVSLTTDSTSKNNNASTTSDIPDIQVSPPVKHKSKGSKEEIDTKAKKEGQSSNLDVSAKASSDSKGKHDKRKKDSNEQIVEKVSQQEVNEDTDKKKAKKSTTDSKGKKVPLIPTLRKKELSRELSSPVLSSAPARVPPSAASPNPTTRVVTALDLSDSHHLSSTASTNFPRSQSSPHITNKSIPLLQPPVRTISAPPATSDNNVPTYTNLSSSSGTKFLSRKGIQFSVYYLSH